MVASRARSNFWTALGQGLGDLSDQHRADKRQAELDAVAALREQERQADRAMALSTARFNVDDALRERGGQLGSVTGLLAEPRYGASPDAGMPDDIRSALRQSEGPSIFDKQSLLTLPEPGELPEYEGTAEFSGFDLPQPDVLGDVETVRSGGRTFQGLDTPVGPGYAEDPTTRAQRLAEEKAAAAAAAEQSRREQMRRDYSQIPGADPALVEVAVRGLDPDVIPEPVSAVPARGTSAYEDMLKREAAARAAGNPRAAPTEPSAPAADLTNQAYGILNQFKIAGGFNWEAAKAAAPSPQVRTAINALHNQSLSYGSGFTGAATETVPGNPTLAALEERYGDKTVPRRPSPESAPAGRAGAPPAGGVPATTTPAQAAWDAAAAAIKANPQKYGGRTPEQVLQPRP